MGSQEEFDDYALENVANGLGEAWPTLATYLSFDDDVSARIVALFPNEVSQQAYYLLRAWREGYAGTDMLGDLKGALKAVGRHRLLAELGEEILDNETIKQVAQGIDESWPELALYLCFNVEECQAIKAAFPTVRQQSGQMLAAWRQRFTGDNPVEYLATALIEMERDDMAKTLAPIQRYPSCPCNNEKALKYRPYYSTGGDGLLGICCTDCGQEWLEDRFLFHPDTDNTREKVNLHGVVLKKQLPVTIDTNPAFQVRGSRTKIENIDYISDYLKVGDQLTWHRPWGLWHHAIVSEIGAQVGKVKIIHWSKTSCGLVRILEKWVDLQEEWGELFRIDYPEETTRVNTPELVIGRAKSRLDDTGYGLFGDNCEAFAAYCKTGVAESCQVVWFYNKCKAVLNDVLGSIVKGVGKAGCVIAREYAKEGTMKFLAVSVAESIERLEHASNAVGVGLILVFEGVACLFDLSQFDEQRKTGGISRKDWMQTTFRRVSEAFFGAGLAAGVGIAGQAAGAAAGTLVFPGFGTAVGGFLGSIIGGAIGYLIGTPLGSLIGSPIGRALTSMIGTDDRAVNSIGDLEPGDQVVFYGNLLHPRHHAIVVECDAAKQKVRVVHNTYQQGVVEEFVDFILPVYRLVYHKEDCYPPDEVITRARSKIGDDTYRYSLAWNNCKTFAGWCKQK